MGFEEWAHRIFVLGDDDDIVDPPEEVLSGATELCLNAGRLVDMYSREQLNEGLWHLVGAPVFHHIYDVDLPEQLRLQCVASIRTLYTDLFERYCESTLRHGAKDEPDEPLNSICYMWWDLFPSWGHPDKPSDGPIDRALLALMRDLLDSRNVAVVESALHGLGHWHLSYPREASATVDGYLRTHQKADPVLRQYATWARNGHVM